MTRSPDSNVDIRLFKNIFDSIEPEFLHSIVSLVSVLYKNENFLMMTENATYAYGHLICLSLSLKNDPKQPQLIPILNDKKIQQVDYGRDFVAILTNDGQVYIATFQSQWKTNKTLKLINTNNDQFKMIACGFNRLLLLRQDGIVFSIGGNSSYETMVNIGLQNVELIASGWNHFFAMKNTKQIYSWGSNFHGQLGIADVNEQEKPYSIYSNYNYELRYHHHNYNVNVPEYCIDVVAGFSHSLFLFSNGNLLACGQNYQGQLGLGDNNNRSTLVKIPIENVKKVTSEKFNNFSFAFDGSSYYAWGSTKYGEWQSPRKLDGHLKSFAAASSLMLDRSITFGLTSIKYDSESIELPSKVKKATKWLFNNPNNYDFEFIIGDKRIVVLKDYLKSESKFFRKMLSGEWSEKNQIIINDYSYDSYYAFLRMLHDDYIEINSENIAELIHMADYYCEDQLMKHCKIFLRDAIKKHSKYQSLIIEYNLVGL